jgi:hypothetical protein
MSTCKKTHVNMQHLFLMWWAIGVLAFEMLSGENPFYHDNPEQVAIKVQRKKLIYSKHLSGPCVSLL